MKFKVAITILAISVFMYSCKTASWYYNKAEKQYMQGEYAYAIENYKQALGKGANAKECNYKLGESHRKSNHLAESGDYYKAAIDAGTTHETSYLYYGLALKASGKYEDAIQVLKSYTKSGSNSKVKRRAKFEYKKIAQIEKIPHSKTQFKVENFDQINDEGDDYGPSSFGDKIIFASSRGESKTYGGTGFGFSDLYTFTYDDMAQKTSGFVSKLDENVVNQDYTHEAEATISPDGNTIVFARGNDGSKKGDHDVMLYSATMQPDGNWSAPKKLTINDPEHWNGCPKFSRDGKHLFFGSNRKGRGGIDLFKASFKDGQFSHVKNMGKKINSVGNDMFPFEHEDGTFYFSSDGHISYGGLDLFKAEKDERGRYTKDINLGNSINTSYDDFGMYYSSKGKGFFCSNRPGGKGRDDIYKFKEVIEPYYFLNAMVKGISDSGTVPLVQAKLVLRHNDEIVSEDFTDSLGEFHIKLKKDYNYTILAQKDLYFTGALEFTVNDQLLSTLSTNEDGDYVIPELVNLNKIVIGAKPKDGEKPTKRNAIVFDNIFYDVGRALIREDAKPGLDKVVKFMQDNPGITVELSSHTDSRDSDAKNQVLSQLRADSAVFYILQNGVAENRITAKGYGESLLINQCKDGVTCTEEEHQANRRTEIEVTGVSNTIEEEHKKYEQSKLEEELERQRLDELHKAEEDALRLEREEKDRKKLEEDRKKDKEKSEYEKYLEMKKKMEEMEKKFKESEDN